MPNTLTTIFRTVPSTEPAEAPHPNTGVYVTGTQLADGTWQVVHTLINKTANPLTITGRLKNFPAITASIVASGNILNIQQPAPTGVSAVGSGTTSISITGNSGANATAYRFYSGSAQAGPFTVLITQASATYNNAGLAAGAVVWYQMQYVGGGFYDDSPVSAAFSGTAGAAIVVLTPALSDFTYNVRNSTDSPPFSALSSLYVNLSGAAYVDVEYTNTRAVPAATANGQPDPYGVSVNSLGVFDSVFLASAVGTGLVSRVTFANAAAGVRQFIQGVQERNAGDTGTFGETHITKLTFPAGSTAFFQKPTANTDRLLVLGDSKSVGVYSSNPGRTAWMPVLRGKRPAIDIYSDGWGYRRASVALVDAPTRAVLIANAVRLGITRYVVALATNDRGAGLDPATVMALVSAMADELRAQIPAIIFYVELEYNNGVAANTAWRTAAQNSKGARTDWYRFIDPSNPTTADGTHPNDAGQTAVASSYDAQLDLIPSAPTLATPVLLHAYDAGNTVATWYDGGAGAQNATQATAALQPTLVAGALFGKAAYYFAPGANHYMNMNPLAGASQEYTLIATVRSVVNSAQQFYLDIQTGRIALIAGGQTGIAGFQSAYYTAPGNNQVTGARGPLLQLVGDSFVAVCLGSTGTDLYLNGNLVGSYPVGVTAISTGPRIGAAYDLVAGSMNGQFQGYIGIVEISPGKMTAAQVEARRQATGSVTTAATGFLEDGLLTYTGYVLPAIWPAASAQGGTHDGNVHYTNVAAATAAGIGWGQGVNWYGTGGVSGAASSTLTVVNVATGATAYTATVDLSTKTAAMQILAGVTGLPFAQYKAMITCNSNYVNADGFDFV